MRQSNAFIAVVVLITLPIVYYFGFSIFAPLAPRADQTVASPETLPLDAPVLSFGNPTAGPADAKVTVFSYGDYACEACAQMDGTLSTLWDSTYKEKVRVVWKDLPNQQSHPEAMNAAMAARCAAEQDGFWAYHRLLMRATNGLNDNNYPIFATQAGLDGTLFKSCYESKRTKPVVERDLVEGIRLGIDATPFLFVNGRRVSGAVDEDGLRSIIDAALREAEAAPAAAPVSATNVNAAQ